jgi:uncharacterized protein YutE (UPF0331/DUF86 family)
MDIIPQKITSLQRCVARAREARADAGDNFRAEFNLQDAAVLNIIRACDLAIDLANMLIRRRKLGIPRDSRDSFQILMREKLVESALFDRLKGMVGFRNLAVHQYQEINLDIVESILANDLDDLLRFAETIRPLLDTD